MDLKRLFLLSATFPFVPTNFHIFLKKYSETRLYIILVSIFARFS